jgi:predicted SprT family Zn-dependent metalloprotease
VKNIICNELYLRYFEFAPKMLKRMTYEQLKANPYCLKKVELLTSTRLNTAIGMCYPTKRRIVVNENYFLTWPSYLPYTLYHEMVHLFLYDIQQPWGHTKEFYAIMEDFPSHIYPIDPNVHIHERHAKAGRKLKNQRSMEVAAQESLSQYVERVFGELKLGGDPK